MATVAASQSVRNSRQFTMGGTIRANPDGGAVSRRLPDPNHASTTNASKNYAVISRFRYDIEKTIEFDLRQTEDYG